MTDLNKHQNILDTLSKNHACYVLITCDEPNAEGKMEVKMSYEGDASIASYLLKGAQSFIDDQEFSDPTEVRSNIVPIS